MVDEILSIKKPYLFMDSANKTMEALLGRFWNEEQNLNPVIAPFMGDDELCACEIGAAMAVESFKQFNELRNRFRKSRKQIREIVVNTLFDLGFDVRKVLALKVDTQVKRFKEFFSRATEGSGIFVHPNEEPVCETGARNRLAFSVKTALTASILALGFFSAEPARAVHMMGPGYQESPALLVEHQGTTVTDRVLKNIPEEESRQFIDSVWRLVVSEGNPIACMAIDMIRDPQGEELYKYMEKNDYDPFEVLRESWDDPFIVVAAMKATGAETSAEAFRRVSAGVEREISSMGVHVSDYVKAESPEEEYELIGR